jgi:hypothetical protein
VEGNATVPRAPSAFAKPGRFSCNPAGYRPIYPSPCLTGGDVWHLDDDIGEGVVGPVTITGPQQAMFYGDWSPSGAPVAINIGIQSPTFGVFDYEIAIAAKPMRMETPSHRSTWVHTPWSNERNLQILAMRGSTSASTASDATCRSARST